MQLTAAITILRFLVDQKDPEAELSNVGALFSGPALDMAAINIINANFSAARIADLPPGVRFDFRNLTAWCGSSFVVSNTTIAAAVETAAVDGPANEDVLSFIDQNPEAAAALGLGPAALLPPETDTDTDAAPVEPGAPAVVPAPRAAVDDWAIVLIVLGAVGILAATITGTWLAAAYTYRHNAHDLGPYRSVSPHFGHVSGVSSHSLVGQIPLIKMPSSGHPSAGSGGEAVPYPSSRSRSLNAGLVRAAPGSKPLRHEYVLEEPENWSAEEPVGAPRHTYVPDGPPRRLRQGSGGRRESSGGVRGSHGAGSGSRRESRGVGSVGRRDSHSAGSGSRRGSRGLSSGGGGRQPSRGAPAAGQSNGAVYFDLVSTSTSANAQLHSVLQGSPSAAAEQTGPLAGPHSTSSMQHAALAPPTTKGAVMYRMAEAMQEMLGSQEEEMQAAQVVIHDVLGRGAFGTVYRGAPHLPFVPWSLQRRDLIRNKQL